VTSSSYPKIIDCTISDQTYGIRSDSQTVTVENSSISSTDYDYYLYYSAYLKSTNTSFSKSKVYFYGTGGALDVYWHLDVNVVDANANPVSKANVSVRDYFDTVIYNGTTDLEGWTREIVSEEYKQTVGHEKLYQRSINKQRRVRLIIHHIMSLQNITTLQTPQLLP
jgi:parallel beta-helix repeat protein